jgi:hypothetical protein
VFFIHRNIFQIVCSSLRAAEKKKAYRPKPYEQMTYPGQRVQVDVKVVPRRCIANPELRLYQYTCRCYNDV